MIPKIIQSDNGDRLISLRWVIGLLVMLLMAVTSSWNVYASAQSAKADTQQALINSLVQTRLNLLEWNQSKVLATLELNKDMLSKIYTELSLHRQSGK